MYLMELVIVALVLLDFLLERVARDRCLGALVYPSCSSGAAPPIALPLHLLQQVLMLSAQDKLLGEFDGAAICPEALEMV